MKARADAMAADVVIVNHHLFFADVMLRDEGLAELLPACNAVILDEAHQLPDTATLFFGEATTAGQVADLARDAEVLARTELRDVPTLPDAAAGIVPALRKLRLAAGELPGKFPRDAVLAKPSFTDAAGELCGGARPARHGARPVRGAQRGDRQPRRARRRACAPARALVESRRRAARSRGGRVDPLDRRLAVGLPAARVAAVGGADLPSAARRLGTRVDLHLGHARGRRRLLALHQRARPRRRRRPGAGTARSTTARRRSSACRAGCPSRTSPRTPTPWSTRRCR